MWQVTLCDPLIPHGKLHSIAVRLVLLTARQDL